jgi:hypothetical protein
MVGGELNRVHGRFQLWDGKDRARRHYAKQQQRAANKWCNLGWGVTPSEWEPQADDGP